MFWLAGRCADSIGKPDAGIWELRGVRLEHSFTNTMCWAGIDRVIGMIENRTLVAPDSGFVSGLRIKLMQASARIVAATRDKVVYNSPTDSTLDASLLLLPILRFPDQGVCAATTAAIAEELSVDNGRADDRYLLFRYRRDDDFGAPEDPFVICSFWLAQAYARLGERGKGVRVLEALKSCANGVGLYAEHFSPQRRCQLGNFPQAYSHVGLVNAAFAVSPSWMEVL
jgi:GH15 family glucan-1,4-alpha-glucosidase